MTLEDDIALLRGRLVAELLPGVVREVEALARRVAGGEVVEARAWRELTTLGSLDVMTALVRLERLYAARARAEHLEAMQCPAVGKMAAAGDV